MISMQKPRLSVPVKEGLTYRFNKCVYSTLFLDNWKLRNFLWLVRIAATVDALWICIFRFLFARERKLKAQLHISA